MLSGIKKERLNNTSVDPGLSAESLVRVKLPTLTGTGLEILIEQRSVTGSGSCLHNRHTVNGYEIIIRYAEN